VYTSGLAGTSSPDCFTSAATPMISNSAYRCGLP
jgi:hypothetical protein